ncbi:MAG: Threonine/homoserine/homoserine lactone efflux protein [Methanophagales archaeon]|nr:LysE family translocator [Methanophagales archaeon]MCU4139967.1 Threonine/homoserine/homoserine lactone efflux protein [Methanophagales archaeon]
MDASLASLVVVAQLFVMGFLTGLSGAVIPGPLFAFVVSDTLKKGFISGPLSALGHVIVEMPLIFAFLLGLGFILLKFQHFTYTAGGIAFILMATLIVNSARKEACHHQQQREAVRKAKQCPEIAEIANTPNPSATTAAVPISDTGTDATGTDANAGAKAAAASVLGGAFFTAFNPSFVPWWATAGYAVLLAGLASPLALAGVAVVIAGHVLSDFAWYSLLSFSLSRGRKFLTDKYEAVMLAVASFLAALGIFFLFKGVSSFFS